MTTVVGVGAQWGDEGKGKIVDWLGPRADLVARFQGGNNAGHTLVVDGETMDMGEKRYLLSPQDLAAVDLIPDLVNHQDFVAWITQGLNADRTMEKLGESDRGIIMFRKQLRREMNVIADGGEPMNVFRDAAKAARVMAPFSGPERATVICRAERLDAMGGTGVFTREVQLAVLDGRADLAVHSLKDLPTEVVDGLLLAAVPERGRSGDALVVGRPVSGTGTADADGGLEVLMVGAGVGTGSPRRQAQIRNRRPDLEVRGIRGNVETRLRKLDEGEYDAVVTCFFLDCFSDETLSHLIPSIAASIRPGGDLLVAEFRQPRKGIPAWRARFWLALMYYFFRKLALFHDNKRLSQTVHHQV